MPEVVPGWLLREQPVKRFQIDQYLRQREADQAEMASANGLEGQAGTEMVRRQGHISGRGKSDGRHAASSTGCTGLRVEPHLQIERGEPLAIQEVGEVRDRVEERLLQVAHGRNW